MAKSRRIFREHQHPRDDRGRFAKKGGGRWVGRVARQGQASFVDTSSARPGMRSGTVGGGLLDLGAIGKANAGFNRPTAQKRATPSAPGVAEFMAKPAPKPVAKAPRRSSFELGPQSRASSDSKRVPAFMAKADADMARKRGEARPKGEGGASPVGALGKLTDQQIANGIEMLGTDSLKGRALAAERARRLLDTSRDTRKTGEVTATTPEPRKSTAFDQLFDPDGPSNATVKNKHARNILAQMEAHDWKLVAQDPMLQFTTWRAPDGREMSVQFLTGDKPKFAQGGRYNSRDLSLKAALVYAVTPILEEKGGASIAGAMERLGMPSLAGKSWSDPGPGVRDASLRPLANAQRDMMSAYGPAKKTTAEAVADLRTAAARNREVADQRDAFNRKSGLGNIDGQAAFMRQRADEFEKVAAELEKMDAERAEFEAERDRRAGLPLDIRPTSRLAPARKATPKRAGALAAGRGVGEPKVSTDLKGNDAQVASKPQPVKFTDFNQAGYALGKLTVAEAELPDGANSPEVLRNLYQDILNRINTVKRQGPARVKSKDQYYRPMTARLEEAAQFVHEYGGNPTVVQKLRALADIYRPEGDNAKPLRSKAEIKAESDAMTAQREEFTRRAAERDAARAAEAPAPAPAATETSKSLKAKKGDLVVIERTIRDYVAGQRGITERTDYVFGVVDKVNRDGVVQTYRTPGYGDELISANPMPVMPREKARVLSAQTVDVAAVLAAAKAHTYPNSDTPMPFKSLKEAQDLARPHVGDHADKPPVINEAGPKSLKPGDRIEYQGKAITILSKAEDTTRHGRKAVMIQARLEDTGQEGPLVLGPTDKVKRLPAAAPAAVEPPTGAVPTAKPFVPLRDPDPNTREGLALSLRSVPGGQLAATAADLEAGEISYAQAADKVSQHARSLAGRTMSENNRTELAALGARLRNAERNEFTPAPAVRDVPGTIATYERMSRSSLLAIARMKGINPRGVSNGDLARAITAHDAGERVAGKSEGGDAGLDTPASLAAPDADLDGMSDMQRRMIDSIGDDPGRRAEVIARFREMNAAGVAKRERETAEVRDVADLPMPQASDSPAEQGAKLRAIGGKVVGFGRIGNEDSWTEEDGTRRYAGAIFPKRGSSGERVLNYDSKRGWSTGNGTPISVDLVPFYVAEYNRLHAKGGGFNPNPLDVLGMAQDRRRKTGDVGPKASLDTSGVTGQSGGMNATTPEQHLADFERQGGGSVSIETLKSVRDNPNASDNWRRQARAEITRRGAATNRQATATGAGEPTLGVTTSSKGRTTTVTLPDGTTAQRTSKTMTYTHAVVGTTDLHARATGLRSKVEERKRFVAALEQWIADGSDTSKLKPHRTAVLSLAQRERGKSDVEYYLPGFEPVMQKGYGRGASTSLQDPNGYSLPNFKDPETYAYEFTTENNGKTRWEVYGPAYVLESQRESIARWTDEATKLEAGPRFEYGVARWSQRADTAFASIGSPEVSENNTTYQVIGVGGVATADAKPAKVVPTAEEKAAAKAAADQAEAERRKENDRRWVERKFKDIRTSGEIVMVSEKGILLLARAAGVPIPRLKTDRGGLKDAIIAKVRGEAPAGVVTPADAIGALNDAKTRDEATAVLSGMTVEQLKEIAAKIQEGGITLTGTTKARIVRDIVEFAVGRRLDSLAIENSVRAQDVARLNRTT